MISFSKNKGFLIILVLLSFFIYSGCSEEEKPESPKKENTPATPKPPKPTNETPKNDPPSADEPKGNSGNNDHPGLAADFKGDTYIVKDGDNLNDLARYYYGSWEHWKDIFVANEGKIDDWNVIHPGLRLEIPRIK